MISIGVLILALTSLFARDGFFLFAIIGMDGCKGRSERGVICDWTRHFVFLGGGC